MIPCFRRREWDSNPYRIIAYSYNKYYNPKKGIGFFYIASSHGFTLSNLIQRRSHID